MRRLRASALIGAIICGLAACGGAAAPTPSPTKSPAAQKIECESQGGKWRAQGFDMQPMCDLPAADAGQPCADSDQCDNMCLAAPGVDRRTKGEIAGQCSPRQINFGCHTLVEDGRLLMICMD